MKPVKLSSLFISLCILILGGCSEQTSESENGNAVSENMVFADDNGGITLPDGFQAVVVSDSVGKARHITVDDDGDIYIALENKKNGGGIVALRDEDGDGKADITEYFGDYTGTGIQLHNGFLYFGSDTSVVRYKMNGDSLLPGKKAEMIVEGFPNQSQHAVKPFTFDKSGNMYVNIGAPSNACQEETRTPKSPGQDPCPLLENYAGVWQFSATQLRQTPADGRRYVTGIRNSVALDWNNDVDQLYVVQHGRDQLNTLWPEHFDAEDNAELPAEEFFLANDGDNFGWPYAYYDWQKEQKMKSPEYGGDGQTPVENDDFEDPIMAFPGHWAPNDIIFYNGSQFPANYENGAFIAFHGSWNRAPKPQKGYKVVFVPFEGQKPSGDYQEFSDGFIGQDTLKSPGNAKYRPVGLATGNDGSLYITESQKGKVWRVMYTNENNTGEGGSR